MQNDSLKFKIVLSVFIFFILLFNNSFAYDDKTTHPALTDEIVDFYNLSFPNKQLTSQEKEWIVQGSILEDTPPRWVNHFYDPILQEGWTGEHAGKYSSSTMISWATAGLFTENPISVVQWVNNRYIQERYSRYGGDRTWKQGLEYYAGDNKEEAYKTLGYILHLLEDQSVPDHTRNDTHAHELEKLTGDYGSPYEEYLKKYTRQKIEELNLPDNLKKENQSPIAKQSIEDYLISLATYSNNYFFSKDTINDPKYQNPKIIRDDGSFGYGKDENGKEFLLAMVDIIKNENNKTLKIYSILNREEYYPIIDAYFSRLSRQAVLHGTGVIDLFFQQAKDEIPAHLIKIDTSVLNAQMLSAVGEGFKSGIVQFAASAISSASGFFSNIYSGPATPSQNKNIVSPIANVANDLITNNQQSIGSENNKKDNIVNSHILENVGINNNKNEKEDQANKINEASAKIQSQEKSQLWQSEQSILALKISETKIEKEQIREQNIAPIVFKYTGGSSSGSSGGGGSSGGSSGGGGSSSGNSSVSSAPKTYSKILITEIQLASASSTHDEFVELYNPNDVSVDLADWYVQKKNKNRRFVFHFCKIGFICRKNNRIKKFSFSRSFFINFFL